MIEQRVLRRVLPFSFFSAGKRVRGTDLTYVEQIRDFTSDPPDSLIGPAN